MATTDGLPTIENMAALCVIIENISGLTPYLSHYPDNPHMWPDFFKLDRNSVAVSCRNWLQALRNNGQRTGAIPFIKEYSRLKHWLTRRTGKVAQKNRPDDLWDLIDRIGKKETDLFYSTLAQADQAKKNKARQAKAYALAHAKYAEELEAYREQQERIKANQKQPKKRGATSSEAASSSKRRRTK